MKILITICSARSANRSAESDSDAALYYAHRIISGGGDPLLIFRRLLAHSAEDVGMADPRALVVCSSAMTAFQNMGYPEGLLPLSEAILYDLRSVDVEFGRRCDERRQSRRGKQ